MKLYLRNSDLTLRKGVRQGTTLLPEEHELLLSSALPAGWQRQETAVVTLQAEADHQIEIHLEFCVDVYKRQALPGSLRKKWAAHPANTVPCTPPARNRETDVFENTPYSQTSVPKPPGWASGTRCTSAAAFVQKRDQALLNPEKRWFCIYDFSS